VSAPEDKFWDREADKVAAGQPWTWARAFASVGTSIVFWAAVVAIVYVVVRYA
jgi:hypothetical protein